MKAFLYNSLAERIEEMINNRVIKVGDKLPSVRNISREQGVSVSTALKAYGHLENLGLIESRPKSGYYVRLAPIQQHDLPPTSSPYQYLLVDNMDDLLKTVMSSVNNPNVIPFSLGMPSLALLPVAKIKKAVAQVMRKSPAAHLSYESVQGSESLRKQIAKLSFNHGLSISEQEVIVTAGCMEATNFAILATTQPGDAIAIESPAFFGIIQAIERAGRRAVEISTDPVQGVDLVHLERAIKSEDLKACLFVTNFSNPMGALLSNEKKRRLLDLLAKPKIPLIENDMYGELYYTDERPRTCRSFAQPDQVILCSSLSKTLVPGYRVGWIIPGAYYDAVFKAKMYHGISTSTLPQEIVSHFLENNRFELHLRKMRKTLYVESLKYREAIHKYFPATTRVSQPQGGFIFWIELEKGIDTLEIFKRSNEIGISIAPGQLFSRQSDFSHCFRLCYGIPFSKEVDDALKKLGAIVKTYLK